MRSCGDVKGKVHSTILGEYETAGPVETIFPARVLPLSL